MNHKCSTWLWNCKNKKKECEVIYENIWRNEMSFSDSVLNHRGNTQASSCEILLAVHVDTAFVTGSLLPQELPRALKVLSRHLQTTAQAVWTRLQLTALFRVAYLQISEVSSLFENEEVGKGISVHLHQNSTHLTEMLALNRKEHNPEVVSY